jgi:hypothetical protein
MERLTDCTLHCATNGSRTTAPGLDPSPKIKRNSPTSVEDRRKTISEALTTEAVVENQAKVEGPARHVLESLVEYFGRWHPKT